MSGWVILTVVVLGFYLVVVPVLVFAQRARIRRLEEQVGGLRRAAASGRGLEPRTTATAMDRSAFRADEVIDIDDLQDEPGLDVSPAPSGSVVTPPGPAARPEAPRRLPPARRPLEDILGGTFLAWAGVAALVGGLALGLGYTWYNVGPWQKAWMGAGTGLAMLMAGLLMARRSGLRPVGHALQFGGWAALYFTAYAAHHLPEARLVSGPLHGALLQGVVAAGAIVHAVAFGVEMAAGPAYALALLAIVLSGSATFTMGASAVLALSLLVTSRGLGWLRLAAAVQLGLTLVLVIWFARHPLAHGPETILFMLGLWAVFAAGEHLARPREPGQADLLAAMGGLNLAAVVTLWRPAVFGPEWNWSPAPEGMILQGFRFSVAWTAIWGVLYALKLPLGLHQGRRWTPRLDLLGGLLFLGWAAWDHLPAGLVAGAWSVLAWGAAALALAVGDGWMRAQAYVLLLAVGLPFAWHSLSLQGSIFGLSGRLWAAVPPLVALMRALDLLRTGALASRAGRTGPAERLVEQLASCSLLVGLMALLRFELGSDAAAGAWAVIAGGLLVLGPASRLGLRSFQAVAVLAWTSGWLVSQHHLGPASWHGLPIFWVGVAPAAAASLAFLWVHRPDAGRLADRRWRDRSLAAVLRAAGAAVLTHLAASQVHLRVDGKALTAGWTLAGLAVTLLGFLLSDPQTRWAGLVLLLACLGKVVVVDLQDFPVPVRIATLTVLGLCLLAVSLVYVRRRGNGDKSSRP